MPDLVDQMLNRTIFPKGNGKSNPRSSNVSRRIELSEKHFCKSSVTVFK